MYLTSSGPWFPAPSPHFKNTSRIWLHSPPCHHQPGPAATVPAHWIAEASPNCPPPIFISFQCSSLVNVRASHLSVMVSHLTQRKCQSPDKGLRAMSNPSPVGCLQPRMAMRAARHKIVNLLKAFFFFLAHQLSSMFVYLMCGPRQLFFQCGPETPKVRTPLEVVVRTQIP